MSGATVGFFHVGVTVADMERALRFYRDGLDLEVLSQMTIREEYAWRIWNLTGDQVKSVFLRVPGSEALVELFEFAGVERQPVSVRPCDPGAGHFCVYVDDAEAVLRRVTALGFRSRSDTVVEIPDGRFAGSRVAYLVDADGYHVEVFERPPR